jgi:hypothetical protein
LGIRWVSVGRIRWVSVGYSLGIRWASPLVVFFVYAQGNCKA